MLLLSARQQPGANGGSRAALGRERASPGGRRAAMASGEETKARREIRRALQTAGVQTDGASLAALAEWVVPRARESGSTVRAAAFEAADSAVPHASCAGVLEAAGAHAAVVSLGKAREESGSQSVGFTKRVAVADCFNRARLIWDSTRRTFHPQSAHPPGGVGQASV